MLLGRTAGILWIVLTLTSLAHGQSASLGGNVVDRLENPVAEAKLALTNPQTGATLSATSTLIGAFLISQVPPGRYDLLVRAAGFKPYTRHDVDIHGEPSPLDVRMFREKDDAGPPLKDLQSLATSKPEDYLARFNLGLAYFTQGEFNKSVHEIQEALKLHPGYPPALVVFFQLAMRGGAPAFALQAAQEILKGKPSSGGAAILAAEAYQRMGQADDAADLLDNFLKQNPNDSEVLIESGFINLQRKKYSEAGKALSQAYAMDNSDIRALQGLADIQLANQEPDKAVQLVAAEVEKYPQRNDLRGELASTELRAGQMDKAIADYRSILERADNTAKEKAVIYARLGTGYQSKEDFPHAVENLKKATELEPDNSAYLTTLAGVYDRAGKTDEALATYNRVLKMEPGNVVAMNNTAYLLVKSGRNLDEALRLIQMARRQFPESNEFLDTLGCVYLKKEMVDSASQIFQDLVEKVNTNPTYHYHYAMSLAKKGDKDAALQQLDLALKSHPAKSEEEEIKELIKKLSS